MLGGQPGAGAVVDADERVRAGARLVDDHERQPALDRGREVGVAAGSEYAQKPSDDRLADGVTALAAAWRAGAAGEAREHQQREPASSVARAKPWRNSTAAGSAKA